MATYTQILYQLVFSTKNREHILAKESREDLYHYIWGILKHKKCTLYQINGIEDHLHIATHVHPTIAVSSLIKDIKVSSSLFIKEQNLFPHFKGWQEGYGAFTYNISQKETLVNYIKNQEKHHRSKSFREEYMELLKENGVDFKEEYLL